MSPVDQPVVRTATAGTARSAHLLVLSAATPAALNVAAVGLARSLQRDPPADLAAVAYRLQAEREMLRYRRACVCSSPAEAIRLLEATDAREVMDGCQDGPRRVVFMFPGSGAQFAGMGRDLYCSEPLFREQVDRCAQLLTPLLGHDPREFLYPDEKQLDPATASMRRPSLAMPALFMVEYALARLLMSWNIHPDAMIGHSLGEYVAACLAGVFTVEDALTLVALRGRLFETLPAGAMLSIPLPEEELLPLLDRRLSLAAVNGPAQCVVSGPADAIDTMKALLASHSVKFQQLHIDAATHSHLVEPILAPFVDFAQKLSLRAPISSIRV